MRCLALFSGGLDSMLAVRLMQEQGVEVEALNFKTPFTCCQDLSARAAAKLGVRVTIVGAEDDYYSLVRQPRFGYGKGANPCVDCRIYMFERARRLLAEVGAEFVVSGEVLGQRPKSQKRNELSLIARHSGLGDRLLRPLSAKLLPPTLPERQEWVDRERLQAFHGRNRKPLIELAHRLGIDEIPAPSSGCALTEPAFGRKVHDLVQLVAAPRPVDFELLSVGRHYRYDTRVKLIVGRRESENHRLQAIGGHAEMTPATVLVPVSFQGPTVLLLGPADDESLRFAEGLLRRHTRRDEPEPLVAQFSQGERRWSAPLRHCERAEGAKTISG